MNWKSSEALDVGPDVVQTLIPHRRPFLMVDRINAFRHGAQPVLWARRMISANEEVFAGHFPGFHLWPGTLTIEGLGQTAHVLGSILNLIQGHEANGRTAAHALNELRQLEMAHTLRGRPPAGYTPQDSSQIGLAGEVDIKLLAPVFGGQELVYQATMTLRLDALARFDVEASVGNVLVARGTMTGAIRERLVANPA